MTHVVSVVTAVHGPSVGYLPEAYASLRDQDMPVGWDWQWLVGEDGTTGEARAVLPDDERVSLGTGRRMGQGVARTYALARATGELVRVLDSDDVLAPGALAREIEVLTSHADVGWTTCRVLDLFPDGSAVGLDGEPDPGVLRRGRILDYWLTHDYRAPVHPASLCIRRGLLLNLGGWMALPAGEDTGLLLAAAAVSDGWFIAEPGLYYRRWPGQVTADPAHTDPAEWTARNAVIAARALSLAEAYPLI